MLRAERERGTLGPALFFAPPITSVLRLIGAVIVVPALLLWRVGRKAPSVSVMLFSIVIFGALIFGRSLVSALVPLAYVSAAAAVALAASAYLALRRGDGTWLIVANVLVVITFALGWLAFDWYWGIVLAVIAAGVGVSSAHRSAPRAA